MPYKDLEKARAFWRKRYLLKRQSNPVYQEKVAAQKRKHEKICDRCGTPFKGRDLTSRFCSRTCSAKWMWENGQENRFIQAGESRSRTYRWVWKPGHPMAAKNGLIPEHRFLMAEYLGRLLEKSERVHHINGNKKDNRIENLEVMKALDHSRHHMRFPSDTI